MRIIMLETRPGTEDGFSLRYYHEQVIYRLSDSLAREFIRRGYARALP